MNEWYFASGDSPFFYKDQIERLSWLPQVFNSSKGFGEVTAWRLWIDYPFHVLVKLLFTIGMPWNISDGLFWGSAAALAFLSSYKLGQYFFKKRLFALIASVVYATNTYTLLLFSGGQLGVLFGYAFFPLFFLYFQKLITRLKRTQKGPDGKDAFISAFITGIFAVLDIRLAGIGLVTVTVANAADVLYFLKTGSKRQWWAFFFTSTVWVVLFHSFWILPVTSLLLGGVAPLGQYVEAGIAHFLSFADFSHAIGLLHPNWPENIFGKVYFMQPEFLVLPILAFSSLFFVSPFVASAPIIPFVGVFSALAIAGAFLAKGTNAPFGSIYAWLFEGVPLFRFFRDPTKFYMLTALSYAMLIPATLDFCSRVLSRRYAYLQRLIPYTLTFIFIAFWAYSIRALFTGFVPGNFRPRTIPSEYVRLKDVMVGDHEFSRVLWIPQSEKFGYASSLHPLLIASDIYKESSPSSLVREFRTGGIGKMLAQYQIKYIIVPIDIEEKIFLQSYEYDTELRDNLIASLASSGLTRLSDFKDLAVFENNTGNLYTKPPYAYTNETRLAAVGVFISLTSISAGVILLFIKKEKKETKA
jgi:hypothetical protein